MKKHTVKRGETLYKISKQYGVTMDEICAANPIIKNPDLIVTGWTLNIPEPVDNEALGKAFKAALADVEALDSVQKLMELLR